MSLKLVFIAFIYILLVFLFKFKTRKFALLRKYLESDKSSGCCLSKIVLKSEITEMALELTVI